MRRGLNERIDEEGDEREGISKGSAPGPRKDFALDPGFGCRQWGGGAHPLGAWRGGVIRRIDVGWFVIEGMEQAGRVCFGIRGLMFLAQPDLVLMKGEGRCR